MTTSIAVPEATYIVTSAFDFAANKTGVELLEMPRLGSARIRV